MGTFLTELLHVGLYKRSQGRITRQVTLAAMRGDRPSACGGSVRYWPAAG